jgi:hypothetical protein
MDAAAGCGGVVDDDASGERRRGQEFGAELIETPPPGPPSVTWLAITAVFVIRNVPVARTPPPTKLALLEWITESVTASDP